MDRITETKASFHVNGEERSVTGHPLRRIVDVLREDFGLTGTKEGCGEGECGACLILVDGEPVLSCLLPLCHVDGRQVTTIEGLAGHPLQDAFQREGGAQCGICTPGMIVAGAYYLDHPDAADGLGEALAGNQCRCTGYGRIFESVRVAASAKE